VDTSTNYFVKVHRKVELEDFPNLPDELQNQFKQLFVKVLAIDPQDRRGMRGHDLGRELSGCKTMDINYLGEEYRVVYRIDDRPEAMRVDVYSFERHDPAYDKAKVRALGWG
jgi:mRNA interferase RelE/StbE